MLNVRGPQNDHHIWRDHYNQLAPGELSANPQRPGHPKCSNPSGYHVVMLTYTRNRLTGRSRTLEKMMPELP
jgi:hypothetical protein